MRHLSLKEREEKIEKLEQNIATLCGKEEGQNARVSSLQKLEENVQELKSRVYSDLSALDRVSIARHADRPRTVDYIEALFGDSFLELFGDRRFADDAAIVAGIGEIEGNAFVCVGHEKGCDTQSRVKRNFGMPHPEGFRKALRLFRLAEKFSLPLLLFVDTPGAYPGLEAEERGQGMAIAENLQALVFLKTPILVVILGEAASGGALALGVGDRIAMLEHAYYSVISPEGCASILWKDAKRAGDAAEALKLHAEFLHHQGIIDDVLAEPLGGAHRDPESAYQVVREYIVRSWNQLQHSSIKQLLQDRYEKFRSMGSQNVLR